jgi:TfoX/Sxy family transcriptional regulator of competence genes
MAYDEWLAERLTDHFRDRAQPVTQKKMFGGLCFLLNGHMVCGIVAETLMVRVGKEHHDAALSQPHARPMDFTGRPLRGMVYVAPEGFDDEADLAGWVERGLSHAASLPPKKKKM